MLGLAMIYLAQSGHPGATLSCLDLLTYIWKTEEFGTRVMENRVSRGSLILSKGHAAPALYALALQDGLFDSSDIRQFRKLGGRLQGHPDARFVPWLDGSTGSLGQGFSVGIGQAKAKKMIKSEDFVFVILGDGELQEGQIWEGAMFASHHGLSNIVAVIDRNGLQSDASTEEVMALESLEAKWEAFGWHVQSIQGHDYGQISNSIQAAKESDFPAVIVANTVKGKGVRFMEGVPEWHGSVAMSRDQLDSAIEDLEPSTGCLGLVEHVTREDYDD